VDKSGKPKFVWPEDSTAPIKIDDLIIEEAQREEEDDEEESEEGR
jgi:hypothetical protein